MQGETKCSHVECIIIISPHRAFHEQSYAMENTLPHEIAHVICVMSVPECLPDDHGKKWQAIALELGVSKDDGYISNPENN